MLRSCLAVLCQAWVAASSEPGFLNGELQQKWGVPSVADAKHAATSAGAAASNAAGHAAGNSSTTGMQQQLQESGACDKVLPKLAEQKEALVQALAAKIAESNECQKDVRGKPCGDALKAVAPVIITKVLDEAKEAVPALGFAMGAIAAGVAGQLVDGLQAKMPDDVAKLLQEQSGKAGDQATDALRKAIDAWADKLKCQLCGVSCPETQAKFLVDNMDSKPSEKSWVATSLSVAAGGLVAALGALVAFVFGRQLWRVVSGSQGLGEGALSAESAME